MSIPVSRYVDITSGVGGASVVSSRELIGRYLSTSDVLLPGEIAEFSSLDAVALRFASNTPEYAAAAMYFAYVSKMTTSPKKLSMARWVKTAIAPMITGVAGVSGASQLALIQAGTTLSLLVTLTDGTQSTVNLTGIDLSTAIDYASVAATVQAAIRGDTNPQLAAANVLYTAATGTFTLQGGVAGGGSISAIAQSNPSTDVAYLLSWLSNQGATESDGQAAQTPVEAVTESTLKSDNFGCFGFMDSTSTPPTPLTDDEIVAVAAWNAAQNVKFMYCVPTTIDACADLYNLLKGYAGTAVTIANDDYAEYGPAEVLAATDYTRANSSQNYMYIQFSSRDATVTDETDADIADGARANYNGQTMTAGAQLTFYQRGILMGGSTAPVDMNVYANEMWLKDNIVTNILNAFLALPRVPANDTGRAIILANVQPSIDAAVKNGTISVGKLLTTVQKQYITQVTDDPDAWQQVQGIGYWIDVEITSYVTTDGRTEYLATYLLIYAKDDQVRKVEGTDTLI